MLSRRAGGAGAAESFQSRLPHGRLWISKTEVAVISFVYPRGPSLKILLSQVDAFLTRSSPGSGASRGRPNKSSISQCWHSHHRSIALRHATAEFTISSELLTAGHNCTLSKCFSQVSTCTVLQSRGTSSSSRRKKSVLFRSPAVLAAGGRPPHACFPLRSSN